MQRAVSVTRVPKLSGPAANRGTGFNEAPTCRQDDAEYVVNRSAIVGSVVLLGLLVGVPAGAFALWPSLFFSSEAPVASGPVVESVALNVNETPAAPAHNPVLEALRRAQAQEAEARAAQQFDVTRRTVRNRRSRRQEETQHVAAGPVHEVTRESEPAEAAEHLSSLANDALTLEAASQTRLNLLSEEVLLRQLFDTPEVRLDDDGTLAKQLLTATSRRQQFRTAEIGVEVSNRDEALPDPAMLQQVVAQRSELAGLPFRWNDDCRLERDQLAGLSEVSRAVRMVDLRALASTRGSTSSESALAQYEREKMLSEKIADPKLWRSPQHVSALEQMFLTENEVITRQMVDIFREIPGPEATQALARRALYDVLPDVRTKAIEALRDRESADYQPLLVAGLQYPWAPAAINAADALIELDAKQVVPQLEEMLEQPAPNAPHLDEQGRWVVRELVKLNHLRNCTLCHAPFKGRAATSLSGFVPTPSQPLPQMYYQSGGSGFVRADIVYLRQDFSLMQVVENADPWPYVQRFDYLVRTRVLSEEEQIHYDEHPPEPSESPQREALQYALMRLTAGG